MTSTPQDDLTCIFLTSNEHPEHWTKFHLEKLLEAVGDYPLITVTTKPLGLKGKEIIQTEYSHYNMYRQLLKACRLATTPYIGVAESDTLYHPAHFTFYRPPLDAVAYDMSRWTLFTWRPIYSIRRRICNATMIASREYLIEALEERYGDNSKCPKDDRIGEVGRHIHEKALKITLRKAIEVWCYHPSIQVNHPNNISYQQAHHPEKKTLGEMKALNIPYWGEAEYITEQYR